jgi:hypothetical protein
VAGGVSWACSEPMAATNKAVPQNQAGAPEDGRTNQLRKPGAGMRGDFMGQGENR